MTMQDNAGGSGTAAASSQKNLRRAAPGAPSASGKKAGKTMSLGNKGSIILVGALGLFLGALIMHVRDRRPLPMFFVNGHVITRDEFDHQMEISAGNQVAQILIGNKLKEQFLKKQGVWPTQAQIDQKLAKLRSVNPNFDTIARSLHETPDDEDMAIALTMAQNNLLSKGVTVTDAEVRSFYALESSPENPNAAFYQPEAVQLEIIINKDKNAITAAQAALAGGANFADVARKYSMDTSKNNGGVVTFVKGRTNLSQYPGLQQKVFAMAVGQQINGFKCAGGFWIIRCVAHSAAVIKPFDQVEEECRKGALLQKAQNLNQEKMNQEFAQFRSTANIVSVNPTEFKINLAAPTSASAAAPPAGH